MEYILASQSPRRVEILKTLISDFKVIPADCDETTTKTEPCEIVKDLALQKAANIKSRTSGERTIIAADTIVVINSKILGKPKDEDDGLNMLLKLQGNWHTVYTGVCVINSNDIYNYYESTDVHMVRLDKNEIQEYIKTGEPMDKAGAYGIQGLGGRFIDEIKGEYETVVGLPVRKLKALL